MTFDLDPAAMSLPGLARACAEETGKYRRGETVRDGYCMELLWRAICDRDGAAWEVVLTQYRSVVLAWVRQHPASASMAEEGDYWVMRVFERFWMAIGPDRFGSFGQLETDPNASGVGHSDAIYLLDRKGRARVLVHSDITPEALAGDVRLLAAEH